MAGGVRVRNTTVNGGMTGRDVTINKVFAYKDGKTYSQMKRFNAASNPNTPAQQQVRGVFTSTSSRWSSLTEAERALWNASAPDWKNTGIFGLKDQSGKNLFTGTNIAKVMAGMLQSDVVGSKETTAVIGVAELSRVAGVITANATILQSDADARLQLLVSKQVSAGTSASPKCAIFLNHIPEDDLDSVITAQYVAKYGALQAGQKIFYEYRLVSAGGNTTKIAEGNI